MKLRTIALSSACLAAAAVMVAPATAFAAATAYHERTQVLDWNAPAGSKACVTPRSIYLDAGYYNLRQILPDQDDSFYPYPGSEIIHIEEPGGYTWTDCAIVASYDGKTADTYDYTTEVTQTFDTHQTWEVGGSSDLETSGSFTWGSALDPQF